MKAEVKPEYSAGPGPRGWQQGAPGQQAAPWQQQGVPGQQQGVPWQQAGTSQQGAQWQQGLHLQPASGKLQSAAAFHVHQAACPNDCPTIPGPALLADSAASVQHAGGALAG